MRRDSTAFDDIPPDPGASWATGTRSTRRVNGHDGETPWPKPLGDVAYHGSIGEIVRAIEPHTEADPAALLFQVLTAVGNCIGPDVWYAVEGARHAPNLFVITAGRSAKARKGTALNRVQ